MSKRAEQFVTRVQFTTDELSQLLACRRHAEDQLDLELSLDAHERLYRRVAGE